MENNNKIICSLGYTINKSNLNTISKNNNLFVGMIFNKNYPNTEYLTILDFDLNSITTNSFDSAFLNIYIKSSKFTYNKPVILYIYENTTYNTDTSVNTQFITKMKSYPSSNIEINPYDIDKYVKVDITPILISIISNKKSSSITIKLLNLIGSTIIDFDSFSSKNTPFIELVNLNKTNIEADFNEFKILINNKISKLANILDTNNLDLNNIKDEFIKVTKNITEINNNISILIKQIETLNKELEVISITPLDLN